MSDLIRLKSVGVSFGESVILKDISFNLKAGRILTLLGPNGAGEQELRTKRRKKGLFSFLKRKK